MEAGSASEGMGGSGAEAGTVSTTGGTNTTSVGMGSEEGWKRGGARPIVAMVVMKRVWIWPALRTWRNGVEMREQAFDINRFLPCQV